MNQRRQVRFERIVEALSADLYRYALFLSRRPDVAEDLVQETLLRGWRFFHKLRDESKAKSWLFTTVRREFYRRLQAEPALCDVDLERFADERAVDPDVWTVRRAVAALPDRYRDVLVLQIVGGYSGNEIAGMLGIPRATVNTRLFRARQRVREAIEGRAAAPLAEVSDS